MLSSSSGERSRCETIIFAALTSLLTLARDFAGVSGRAARGGEQGQEVHEKKDGLEEDRGKYHHGQ